MKNRYCVVCLENEVYYDVCGLYDKDVAEEVAEYLAKSSHNKGHRFIITTLNPLMPPQESDVEQTQGSFNRTC